MPPLEPNSLSNPSVMARAQTFLTLFFAVVAAAGIINTWYSDFARADDIIKLNTRVDNLSIMHNEDMNKLQISRNSDKITEITLKPNKSQYDRDLLQYYTNKKQEIPVSKRTVNRRNR